MFNHFNYRLKILLFSSLLPIFVLSCASHMRKETVPPRVLTDERLYEINNETRFTRFYYTDGKMFSGLMIRWMPDSIYIQPRGVTAPLAIPTAGINRIETVTGNKMFSGLVIGALAAGIYFVAVRGYDLKQVTFFEGIAKLLGPPAILLTGMGIGASKDTYETFLIPPGFFFDYENAKLRYQKE